MNKILHKKTRKKSNLTNKTKKYRIYKQNKTKRRNVKQSTFVDSDFNSGDGMLTTVWGPSLWHYLHTMSFNYPVNPTKKDKEKYKKFMLQLQYVLPCIYCRINLKNNLKKLPLTNDVMKNRASFSLYVYELHEHINEMLGKKSGLTYDDVKNRYEHFRSRCIKDLSEQKYNIKTKNKKENGCTNPLYGKKSKCVIKIVPQEKKCETFQMDNKCKYIKL